MENRFKIFYSKRIVVTSLVITLLLAVASSFRYISNRSYIVPLFFAYLISVPIIMAEVRKQFLKVIIYFLPFGIWAVLTSLWSLYPELSFTRGFYYLLMSSAAVAAAVLSGRFAENLFYIILPLNTIVVLSSLISLITGFPDDSWTAGNSMGFMGFTIHQNTLGALILFTIPAPVYLLIEKYSKLDFKKYFSVPGAFLVLLIVLNLIILLTTHSRASILSLMVMILVLIFWIIKLKHFLIFSFSFLILSLVLYQFPPTQSLIKDLLMKNETKPGANRWYLYEASYEAAKMGGLTGLGYGVSHPDIQVPASGSHFENAFYIREKGNSQLALIEETGIIGFILFLMPLSVLIISLVKKRLLTVIEIVLTASIAAFFIHSLYEGWWVGVRTIYLFEFMLFLSLLILRTHDNRH